MSKNSRQLNNLLVKATEILIKYMDENPKKFSRGVEYTLDVDRDTDEYEVKVVLTPKK